MSTVYEDKKLVNKPNSDANVVSEDYLSDFFSDESCLLEEMDVYAYLMEDDVANDEIWDVMQIDETEDTAAWLIY